MKLALAQHDLLLRRIIEEHHGYVFKTVGDAFCAAFAVARDALQAAIVVQQSLQTPLADLSIRVRIALHSGAAEERNGDYFGPDLNRLARLLSAGHGGQVLLSGATKELVQDLMPADVTLRELGDYRLKDLVRPEQVFQLLIPDLAADFPPLKALDVLQHNLPVQLSSFIGRQKELAALEALLAADQPSSNRLVTLTGSGGVGKTRLSLQAAQKLLPSYSDGVWLIELAALADPGLVPQAVASQFAIREERDRPLLAALADYLREKTLLLVLDNCEHVIGACAQLADYLIHRCPGLRILATSREALGVEGETIVLVPLLSLPATEQIAPDSLAGYEAVQLFVARASAAFSGFAVTDANASAIVQVCRRLDGIALAIELAAARAATLRVEEIASRLEDTFRLLTSSSRTSRPRQQTLRATIEWSYNLLSAPECMLLRRLSVFKGGWTVEAAEAICSGDGVVSYDVLDLLTQVVSKSLVIAERQLGQETRFRLLETTRQFAWEKLQESSEGESIRDLHLAFFLRLAEEIEVKRKTAERLVSMKQSDFENDNFRAALEWAFADADAVKVEYGLRLASAHMLFWHRRGRYQEGSRWLAQGLTLSGSDSHEQTAVRAKAYYAAGYLSFFHNSDTAAARAMIEESIRRFRRIDPADQGDIVLALSLLAVDHFDDDLAAARTLIAEGVAIGRRQGPSARWNLAEALFWSGHFAFLLGDYVTAQICAEESRRLFQLTGDVWEAAAPISTLGHIAVRLSDYAAARTYFEKSLMLWTEGEDSWSVAYFTGVLGHFDRIEGDYVAAGMRYEESLLLWREMGVKEGVGLALRDLGIALLGQGDYEQAARLLVESLPLVRELGDDLMLALSLAGLSAAAEAQGQEVRAARLMGASEMLGMTTMYWSIFEVAARTEYERLLASGRAQKQDTAFAAAWAEGQAMGREQMVEYALTDDWRGQDAARQRLPDS